MSANSSKNSTAASPRILARQMLALKPRLRAAIVAVGYLLWVFVSFIAGALLMVLLLKTLIALGVDYLSLSEAVRSTIEAATAFGLSLIIALYVPRWLFGKKTTRDEVGLSRGPTWFDLLAGPLALIPYFILAIAAVSLAQALIPGFDIAQKQDVGFNAIGTRLDYSLAFITLVVIAPIVEETLFRGYLYGKLRPRTGMIVASLLVSALFGFLHGQWNVGVNVFALSIVLCGLRELTGSIWAGILLHMAKNAVAFYALFVVHL